MIVHCIELGSHWWTRITSDNDGNFVPVRSAFFNSTALPRGASGTHWLRCWTIPGIVRFNVAGFPRATMPTHLQNISAFSEGLDTQRGGIDCCFVARLVVMHRLMPTWLSSAA